MTNDQNASFNLIILSIIAALLVIGGTVWAMRAPVTESRSTVSAPGVDVQTQGSDVKINAPYTSIKKDDGGTSIKAPGVDIQLPPSKAD
ncbi:MAG: hypothetical protein IKE66_09835 [Hyphomicrobium sp.]|nr:hypothetical protein [Hyphomicrobium sp.]